MKIPYELRNKGKLTFFKQGDWIDLSLEEDVILKPGEFKACSLRVRMELPKGFEAIVALRSSTGKNFKVLQYNAPGIIDESYSGPKDIWHILLYAPKGASIKGGERVAQFRIQPKMKAGVWTKLKWLFTQKVRFVECELGDSVNRGGLGSTNKK